MNGNAKDHGSAPPPGVASSPTMRRSLFNIVTAASMVLCVVLGVLWVRGRGGAARAEWKYNRWRSDGSAASNETDLSFGARIEVAIRRGYAPPRVPKREYQTYCYYASADRSGGRPSLRVRHRPYVPGWGNDAHWPTNYDSGVYSGWGPLRWYGETRPSADGIWSSYTHIGISHWLVALPLLAAPVLWLKRFVARRRVRKAGLCPGCGYDLRATPQRCPECGGVREVQPVTAA